MRKFGFVAALLLLASSVQSARAIDITLNKNGYASIANGQLTGTGIIIPQTLGNTSAPASFTGLLANTTYSLDFFGTSGTGSSDFSFKVNAAGTGIESVSLGGSVNNMVVGFNPGDTTLMLNTGPIVTNANQKMNGNHSVNRLYANSGVNYPATPNIAVPGIYAVDNLYNSGSGNEDFQFKVNDTFQTSAETGVAGPNPGIPFSEYATFSGNQVNVRSELVHFIVDTNVAMAGAIHSTSPMLNYTTSMGGTHIEFDMNLMIGAGGIFFSDYGNFDTISSNAFRPDGSAYDTYSGINDFAFYPTLRYDGTSNANGYYWLGPGPGIENEVTAYVEGFRDGNLIPLNLTVTAIMPAFVPPPLPAPEPTTLALLGLGMATVAMRRHKRS